AADAQPRRITQRDLGHLVARRELVLRRHSGHRGRRRGERVRREQRAFLLVVDDDRLDLGYLAADDLEARGEQHRRAVLLEDCVHGGGAGASVEEIHAEWPELRRRLPEAVADREHLRVLGEAYVRGERSLLRIMRDEG